MIPPVTLPSDSKIRIPVDLKLKTGWRLDRSRRVFESDSGEKFTPRGDLPKNSRIVYKVPTLAGADPSKLSKHERELQRYVQVILPPGESPADYVDVIRKWPCVAEAHIAPEISLPTQA
ncbi:MAG: hypothetical protein AABO57_02960 [Acidobacteriota bacterium]